MKHELRRIEATLNQLQDPASSQTVAHSPLQVSSVQLPLFDRTTAVTVQPRANPQPATPTVSQSAGRSATTGKGREIVQLPAVNLSEVKTPALPKVSAPRFTSHRHAANPSLAKNLLREIEGIVVGWQAELQTLGQQIQELYLEGPIVAGWLESYTQEDEAVPTLRHADVECLMDYVEKRWSPSAASDYATVAAGSGQPSQPDANAAGYRLCGLNDEGQLWFRHCPADQVPAVSLAIARYQKLRQMLIRKQDLETRLSQLAETLIGLHSQLTR